MRIVITGATGNVGSALVRRLLRDPGEHEVVGLARRVPAGTTSSTSPQWHSVDLTDPACERTLAEVFAGADAVVHLAWAFQPTHRPDRLEDVGVGGSRRVLQAVTRAGVPHLVHLSSLAVYSPHQDDVPVDEGYPTDGIPTSTYSRHKVAVERLLDEHVASSRATGTLITRMRPGVIGQRSAGSALLRYGLPGYLPARLLGLLPVLPLDRGLAIPFVHSDDVADAVARAVEQRAGGAFNLAADPPVTSQVIAQAFGARLVHVPSSVLRASVAASWHAHVQPLDPGWIDLAFALPLLDSGRARRELGWEPAHDAASVFAEVVDGMTSAAAGPTPVLRRRTPVGALADALRSGPVSHRNHA
jgi:UDP-glucose 4-epimerase